MKKIISIVEYTISSLKGDQSYKINIDFTFSQLIRIIYYRTVQLFRGMVLRIFIKQVRGLFFAGRKVLLEHSNQLRVGKNVIVEDGVFINALSRDGIIFGNNVTIAKHSIIMCTGVISHMGKGIVIGNNTAVGAQSFLGGQGGIVIGNDVIMGPGVRIFSENHNYTRSDINIRNQGENRTGVVIEDNCWIGASVTILDGCMIGAGSVIAAGAVITHDVSENSVIAGVPGKLIKKRI